MRILVINGPNLNLLGTRQPDVYGTTTLAELEARVTEWGAALDIDVETFQSNHEGELIEAVQGATADGMIVNGGALTHSSFALHDAIAAAAVPAVEVHISNIHEREPWRRVSVTAPACVHQIYGRGIWGYKWALRHLVARRRIPPTTVPYGSTTEQVGDLRQPAATGPHPVVVLFHGGYWLRQWTRDLMDGLSVDLAKAGFATWNVEYRRTGTGGGWPFTFSDAVRAVDHLVALADDHPIDLDNVALLGHSAGALLALWAAGRRMRRGLAPGPMPQVRPVKVVGLAPVVDLAEAERLSGQADAISAFIDASRYPLASPMELPPLDVPQLLAHGTEDRVVPIAATRRYAETRDGVTYRELDGVGHMALVDERSEAWRGIRHEL